MSLLSRRTRARLSFLSAVVSLVQQHYQGSIVPETEMPSLRSRWVAFGAVYRFLYCWAYDHDVGRFRTSRWRRGLFSGVAIAGLYRLMEQSPAIIHSGAVGSNLVCVVYRFWYGVLYPVPGQEE